MSQAVTSFGQVNASIVFGRRGEDLAARLYESSGWRVLERNYRVPEGEIDLVARRGGVVAFCEVKTRGTDRWGLPAEAVAPPKQARLRRLAARWMSERRPGPVEIRFDVVSIVVREGRPELMHFPNAF